MVQHTQLAEPPETTHHSCQAILNPQKGIFISTSYDNITKNIVVTIKDQGVGISSENLPHLTDTFFSTKYESGGIGLGLSISSKILEEHSGKMTFSSEVDKGTTVTVTLPVAPAKKVVREVSV